MRFWIVARDPMYRAAATPGKERTRDTEEERERERGNRASERGEGEREEEFAGSNRVTPRRSGFDRDGKAA